MSTGNLIQPTLTVLRPDQVQQLHDYSLRILSTTGVRVDSQDARRLFSRAIGPGAIAENRVRLPGEVVEWALSAAPATVDIYDRQGNHAFCLGNDRLRFGIGVTVLHYQEPVDDEVVQFTREHMTSMVRLGNTLPNYDVVSTIGILQDLPPQVADLYATLEMIANTTKPLVLLVSDETLFPAVLDLLQDLIGDPTPHPFALPYLNPITPLVMNSSTTDKMLLAIERGLPVIYSSYSMAGMSSPITPVGNLALLNAELLAGLTLSQLAREGSPIVLGSLPNYFDMKTMISFYDAHSILMSLACAEMMAYYHLPHCGTSGSANGWGPDISAIDAYWMNTLTGCLGKSGLAPFVGDTLGAKAFSPVSVVHTHEIIAQSRRLAQGFQLDDITAVLDELEQVGPGGQFLITEQTLRHYRTAYYHSPFSPRWSMSKWLARGQPKADNLLREYTQELLANPQVPADHADLLAKGEEFVQRLINI